MTKRLKTLAAAALLLFPFSSLKALTLEELLPGLTAAELAKLREKKELVLYADSVPEFKLLPGTALSAKVKRHFSGFEPNVSDEALFLMPLPPAETDLGLYLYNKLRAISTLSGITYFSNRHRETRVLFSDVYAVDSFKGKKRVPDVSVRIAPEEERIPIHLEDVNFGSGYYEVTYLYEDDVLGFGMKNLTSLKYIFPVIGKENVRFQLVIVPLEKELLMYGVCAVEAAEFVKSMIHLPSAFYTRIRALRDWFSRQVY